VKSIASWFKPNIYCSANYFTGVLFLNVLLFFLVGEKISFGMIAVTTVLNGSIFLLVRLSSYIMLLYNLNPNRGAMAFIIGLIITIELSYRSYDYVQDFRNNIQYSLRHYFRYLLKLLKIRLKLNADFISFASVIVAIIGLVISINQGNSLYGILSFLIAFILDYFDGYIAEQNSFHSQLSTKVDGVCDRLVELLLIIFYFFFQKNIYVTAILGLGYIFNILYLIEKQKYCVIQVRPYVILSFIYPIMNKLHCAICILLLPFIFRIAEIVFGKKKVLPQSM